MAHPHELLSCATIEERGRCLIIPSIKVSSAYCQHLIASCLGSSRSGLPTFTLIGRAITRYRVRSPMDNRQMLYYFSSYKQERLSDWTRLRFDPAIWRGERVHRTLVRCGSDPDASGPGADSCPRGAGLLDPFIVLRIYTSYESGRDNVAFFWVELISSPAPNIQASPALRWFWFTQAWPIPTKAISISIVATLSLH